MKWFLVKVPEVYTATIRVEAESKDEAIKLAYSGKGAYLDGIDFSHSLDDTRSWDAEEE